MSSRFFDPTFPQNSFFFRYNGKQCTLANLRESFRIGGEGRKLTPRPRYGTLIMVRSKYVVGI